MRFFENHRHPVNHRVENNQAQEIACPQQNRTCAKVRTHYHCHWVFQLLRAFFLIDHKSCVVQIGSRVDAFQNFADLFRRLLFHHQIRRRTRQDKQHNHAQNQRQRATPKQSRAPAKFRNQPRCEKTASRRANWETAIHRVHNRGAFLCRAKFSEQGYGVGHGCAQTQTCDKAQNRHLCDVLRVCRCHAHCRKQKHRKRQHHFAPDFVGNWAKRHRANRQTKQCRAQHGGELFFLQPPIV